jgi:predicted small metal-binding protein
MKMLACKAMGGSDDFFAKGNTEEEVMSKMMNHVKDKHPEMMEGMDDMKMKEMKEMMKAKMTDDNM